MQHLSCTDCTSSCQTVPQSTSWLFLVIIQITCYWLTQWVFGALACTLYQAKLLLNVKNIPTAYNIH